MCPLYHTNLEKNNQVSLTKYPKQIELALPPTWCNIGGLNPTQDTACIMCPRSSLQFIQTMSNVDDRTDLLLEKVKPAIPHLETFTILGIAEPFYKGRIFEILDKIEFKNIRKKYYFGLLVTVLYFQKNIKIYSCMNILINHVLVFL